MKITYKFGKSNNWKESAIVGVIGASLCVIASLLSSLLPPVFVVLGVFMLLAGVSGFLKRDE